MGAELRGVQVGRATVEAPDLAWARATTETLRVLYAELAELRDEVHALARAVSSLQEALAAARGRRHYDRDLHSVKVPDHASTPVERGRYTE